MFFDVYSSLCEAKQKTPNGVAKELGFASASVTQWKHGSTPRPAALQKIADYFGVSVHYLLGAKEKSPTVGTGEAKVSVDNIIDKMSRAELLDLIQKATSKLKEQDI